MREKKNTIIEAKKLKKSFRTGDTEQTIFENLDLKIYKNDFTIIMGSSGAGKSTLMNYLTNAGVLAEDKLFATLDPTSRALKLPNGVTVMLIDTVGFVSRLPHKLVEAFKSTLEQAKYADIILNVCDIASEDRDMQLEITQGVLAEIGCEMENVITVYNKYDKEHDMPAPPTAVMTSAKSGYGLDALLEKISGYEATSKETALKMIEKNRKFFIFSSTFISRGIFIFNFTSTNT